MKKLLLIPLFILCFSMMKAQTEVTFYTTKGVFVAEIYDNIVPITGGNFLDLVDTSFYDGIIFHRVIDNFMIQGGDPTGTGSGGPGYTIQDEFDPSLSNLQKTLSMANSGPNTGGSQFFINLVDNTYLDYNKAPLTSKHPVFGMVLMNFNVVQDIGKVPTNSTNNRPLTDVVMDSVRVGNGLTVGTEKPSIVRNKLSVIPNPVNEQSFLNINTSKQSGAVLSIYDDMGKLLALKDVRFTQGSNRIPLDDVVYSMKESGIYFLNLQIEGEYHSLKLMKE